MIELGGKSLHPKTLLRISIIVHDHYSSDTYPRQMVPVFRLVNKIPFCVVGSTLIVTIVTMAELTASFFFSMVWRLVLKV